MVGCLGLKAGSTKPARRSWRRHLFRGTAIQVKIRGMVKPGYELVREEFEASFREEREAAAQLAVYHRGELVVDLWAGEAEVLVAVGLADGAGCSSPQSRVASSTRASSSTSVSSRHNLQTHSVPTALRVIDGEDAGVVFSVSKVAESLVIAMLVDRGHLEFSAPIARYWPEFAEHGKAAITVEQLMRHQAALCALDEPIPLEELQDPDTTRLSARLARQSPNWSLATQPVRQFYHAVTRGFYASELVRRVDPKRRTLGQFFQEEVASLLDGSPFYIGITADQRQRTNLIRLEKPPPSMLVKSLAQALSPIGSDTHDKLEDWEAAHFRGMLTRALRCDMKRTKLSIRSLVGVVKGITDVADPSTVKGAALQAVELPSANGIANARAMAKLASLLAAPVGAKNSLFQNERARREALEAGPKLLDEGTSMEIAYTRAGWGADRFLPGFFGWAGSGDAVLQWCNEHGGIGLGYLPTMAYGRVQKPRGLRLMRAVERAIEGMGRPVTCQ